MSIAAVLVPLAAGGAEEAHNTLPLPAVMYGVGSMATFLVMLAITWAFRNTGQKADQAKARRDGSGAGLGAGTGGHS